MVVIYNYHAKFGIFILNMVVNILDCKGFFLRYLDIFKNSLSDAIEPKKPNPPSIPIDLPLVVG